MSPEATVESSEAIQAHVPMKPVWHQILLAIATGHRHGYAIREAVEERTHGSIRLWPATLYGALRRMDAAGLIAERDDADDPRGKRPFQLTEAGRAVLEAETARLERLVALARSDAALAGSNR